MDEIYCTGVQEHSTLFSITFHTMYLRLNHLNFSFYLYSELILYYKNGFFIGTYSYID